MESRKVTSKWKGNTADKPLNTRNAEKMMAVYKRVISTKTKSCEFERRRGAMYIYNFKK